MKVYLEKKLRSKKLWGSGFEKHILNFLKYYKNINYNLFMTSENRIHQVALEFKEFDNRGKDGKARTF